MRKNLLNDNLSNKIDINLRDNYYPDISHNKKINILSDFKVSSGCAVFGLINETGKRITGQTVLEGIALMHERSNGLGGGFAGYGIYPDFKDYWAFHIMYDDLYSKKQTEELLNSSFKTIYSEEIPVRKSNYIKNPPIIFRYFLTVKEIKNGINSGLDYLLNSKEYKQETSNNINYYYDNYNISENAKSVSIKDDISKQVDKLEEDFIVDFVMKINSSEFGAYIISSGRNMGIFKGVGYPEDIGNYFKIDEYKGYIWTAHGRFPTNSVGWWGGAHPFGLLNWSVVHNGEISSYGRNKRFVASFGYECSLSTDTEVITYLFDLLVRKKEIDVEILNLILAAPFWEQIDNLNSDQKMDEQKQLLKALRIVYGGALINGPFSIIVSNGNYLYALNDRIKLRPLVAAKKGNFLFVSSEEAPINKVCKNLDYVWHPEGGIPVIGYLKNGFLS